MREEAERKRKEEEEDEVDISDLKKAYTVDDITDGLNK